MTKKPDENVVDDDGLNANERAYLTSPVSKLDEKQRHIALAIRDKRDNARYAANQKYREEQARERAKNPGVAA